MTAPFAFPLAKATSPPRQNRKYKGVKSRSCLSKTNGVLFSYHSLSVCRIDCVGEGDFFTVGGGHADDVLVSEFVGTKNQVVDALEALLDVWLNSERVLGLRQNLQQFVVGEEKEPWEEQSLLL